MHQMRSSYLLGIAVVALGALMGVETARAAGPSVTAVLSNSNTVVGQMVQLQVKVSGSANVKAPNEISVDGLEIRYTGQSQLLEGRNFQFTYSFVFNYTILPMKPGTFKIPPLMVEAGGSALRTPALTLQVADSSNNPAPRSSNRSNNSAIDPNKIAFAELTLSKTTAYIGEMIPAVLRVGVNIRTPVESYNGAEITGQGFTAQKMRDERPTIESIEGKTYQVFTFKTALSPARAGKIDIGPVQITAIVRLPRAQSRNQMPRDLFDLNDPFMDNFFSDPFFAPSVPQEIRFKSQAVTLDVKPLPAGAPADFGGAVGNFTLSADAKPKTAQVGDPLTVTATITGRGNFDRVTAPTLEDESGWHKYPPSSEFKQDDEIGISGTKTFETVLSANERKNKIPPQLFSYFDPAKEQYVTLRTEPIPVRVEGGTITRTAPAPAPQTPANAPSAAPRQATQQEILHQLTEMPAESQSFTPLFAQRNFWLAQLIPLVGLLGFIGWKIRAAHLNNRELQRREALQHEAAAIQRSLHRDDVSPEEYFSRASRAVQLKTALLRNVDPNSVDADLAATAFRMDEATRLRLRRLFERSDEARYSGTHNGVRLLPAETRNEVLELIDNLRT